MQRVWDVVEAGAAWVMGLLMVGLSVLVGVVMGVGSVVITEGYAAVFGKVGIVEMLDVVIGGMTVWRVVHEDV